MTLLLTQLGLTNLCPNPSLETDTVGWANSDGGASTGGPHGAMTAGATLTRVTSQSFSGTASLQVSGITNFEMGAACLLAGTFLSGVTYTFSVDLLGNVGGESVNIMMGLGADAVSQTETLTTSWQRFSINWTPSANRSGVYVYVVSQTSSAITWFVDAALVVQGTSTSYFDGNSPGCIWNGTPNDSTSSQSVAGTVNPPTFLPPKLGPKAVGPTFFSRFLAKLSPVSSAQVTPTPAVARGLVPPNGTLASGASVTAAPALARGLVPRGITAGTPPPAPVVTTGSPEALPGLQEQLKGTVNPEGASTTYYFQWGPTTSYGNQTATTSAGTGSSPVSVNATITGLTAGTQFHYRLVATNSGGTTFGADVAFYPFSIPTPQSKAVRVWTDQNPFTYCLYDALSGRFLGTLPFSQVTFGSQLLQPGTFSGTIDVASAAVQALGPFDLIQPGRTALLIDYLGSFIWGGIIWTAPYDQDDTKRQVQVGATEIWSYLANQRVQATDYSAPPYSGITGPSPNPVMAIWDASATDSLGVYDPVLIAWQMLSDAMYYVPNGNLFGGTGILANGYTTASAYLASGTNTPQADYLAENYPYSSLQQLGSAINQLATLGLGVGFDYGVDVSGSAYGPVTCTVNLSYPRRGRTFANNNLVLDCQRALKFSIPSDGTQTANTVYEQGANGALSVSQNAQPLNGGYPILERVMSRSNIQSANVMQVLAQTGAADLAVYSYPPYTPTVTTDLFTGPLQLGQFIVGDDVWWRIPKTNGVGQTFCPRLPSGLNVEARIIAYQASAADSGTSQLTVTLAEPPSYNVQGPWLP